MRGGSAPASTGWTCTRPQISIEIPSTRVCRPSSRPSRTRLARQTLNRTTSPKTPDTTPLKMCRPRPTGDSIAAMIRMAPAARNSAPAIRVRVSAPVLGWRSSISPSPPSSPPPTERPPPDRRPQEAAPADPEERPHQREPAGKQCDPAQQQHGHHRGNGHVAEDDQTGEDDEGAPEDVPRRPAPLDHDSGHRRLPGDEWTQPSVRRRGGPGQGRKSVSRGPEGEPWLCAT